MAKRESLPSFGVQEPACPQCDSLDHEIYKTRKYAARLVLRYKRCRKCGKKFIARYRFVSRWVDQTLAAELLPLPESSGG